MADGENSVKGKYYISGPMRGIPDENKSRFIMTAKYLEANNCLTWNPHDHDADTLGECFQKDVEALSWATNVAFLPGWQNSAGCRIEFLIAKELGLSLHLVFFAQQPDSDEYVVSVVDMLDESVPPELAAGTIVRNGERESAYGPPLRDFQRTADQWASLGISTSQDPADVALAMTALKMSRLKGTRGHYDSIVDAIGYLICYSRIVGEK